ncbi:unnamed protein product [Rhizoctonia solani]|uniref:Uncharacterized protein n=1 Tax=Rhizoctonia solani TaxID=456999 RepID=A0A8H3BQD0_9AGAM|nr:unnamed protein product [Rhizoctonia solani]
MTIGENTDADQSPWDLDVLGCSHLTVSRSSGRLDNLEKAFEYFFEALKSAPDGHPKMSVRLVGLGDLYAPQYQHLVKLTLEGHPDWPSHLENLGASYLGFTIGGFGALGRMQQERDELFSFILRKKPRGLTISP